MNLPAVQQHESGITRQRATELSQSRLMPEHFANDPANVQYVMEIGHSLGIDPVTALSHVHVFADNDGKLKSGLSADLMVALARNAGHIVHISGNQAKAMATLIRTDITPEKIELLKSVGIEPKDHMVFTEVWTAVRATDMGLMNKRNWKLYTPEMLKARVKSGVVRTGCSEVLLGVRKHFQSMGIELTADRDDDIAALTSRYTPDELGVETDEDGVPVMRKSTTEEPSQEDQVRSFVESASAIDISEWAKTTANSDVPNGVKLERFKIVHSMCEKLGRLQTPVVTDGETRTLNSVLMSHVKPLLPNA